MDILRNDMSMVLKRVGGKDDGGIDFFGWLWLPHDSPSPSSSSSSSSSPPPVEHHHQHCRRLSSGGAPPRRRIRVIGQCKAEKKKIGPNYVRELEGVLYRFLTFRVESDYDRQQHDALEDDEDDDDDRDILSLDANPSSAIIALLVSQSAFTKSTVLRANSSAIPFCLLHLPPPPVDPAESEPGNGDGGVGSVWCNPALCGAKGLLKGRMEVRWERHKENSGSARPALWWDGKRLSSWVPE